MTPAIVFLPLLGALIVGALAFATPEDKHAKHRIDALAQRIACAALLASMVLAIIVFYQVVVQEQPRTVELLTWIDSGAFEASWAFKVDSLTAVMMLVVTLVSAMVHVYSIGYMHHDPGIPRFMAYLNLFTFFMLMLVTADNLVQMFFGWEGVGLSSYLLIGFWYDRPSGQCRCDQGLRRQPGGRLRLYARHLGDLPAVPVGASRHHLRRRRRGSRHHDHRLRR